MGKYKEIQIEVSDEVYSALEQLADDLNKAETIILNRTGKQELIGQRSMTVEHIALLAIETYVHNIEKRKCQKPDPLGYTEKGEKNARACNRSKNDRRTGGTS